jgi:hypothetical protein
MQMLMNSDTKKKVSYGLVDGIPREIQDEINNGRSHGEKELPVDE